MDVGWNKCETGCIINLWNSSNINNNNNNREIENRGNEKNC